MDDDKIVIDFKQKWDKAFADVLHPKPEPADIPTGRYRYDLNTRTVEWCPDPTGETIILRTLCGCEREIVVSYLPSRRVYQMPLYSPITLLNVSSNQPERISENVRLRTFEFIGHDVSVSREGQVRLRVFREMLEPLD